MRHSSTSSTPSTSLYTPRGRAPTRAMNVTHSHAQQRTNVWNVRPASAPPGVSGQMGQGAWSSDFPQQPQYHSHQQLYQPTPSQRPQVPYTSSQLNSDTSRAQREWLDKNEAAEPPQGCLSTSIYWQMIPQDREAYKALLREYMGEVPSLYKQPRLRDQYYIKMAKKSRARGENCTRPAFTLPNYPGFNK